MLTYDTLKHKPRKLLALTGLALREFEELLPAFTKALLAAEAANPPKPKKRKRALGAGRKPGLCTAEDKLLFALVYTKTYPLQIVQGQLFGMSQSSANEWLHQLVPVARPPWMNWASCRNARALKLPPMSAGKLKAPIW